MGLVRLFVAIDLPEETKVSLAALRLQGKGISPVAAGQLHLTLRFIGEKDDADLTAIRAALAEIHGAPFSLCLQGIGQFPSGKRPRVLWVGMKPPPALQKLQQRVELAVRAAGCPAEERPFSPHITIARLQDVSPELLRSFVQRHQEFVSPSFAVDSFHLYASRLSATGAVHTLLQSYPLQGS